MNTTDPQPETQTPAGGAVALLQAFRMPHWIKNSFVLAPVLFAGMFFTPLALGQGMLAVAVFCLLASGVYLINDVRDIEQDRAHPRKRNRPVASGRVSLGTAVATGVGLMVLGLTLAGAVGLRWPSSIFGGAGLLVWSVAYVALNILYSWWLKHHLIIDVITISFGFVLRAMAGAAAINVLVSPWMVVCTFTLCLFIALTKRRAEVESFTGDQAVASRGVNVAYNLVDLNVMIAISASMAIITYALYCLAPHTVAVTVGSPNLIWTIPLVVYGVFRFNRLTRTNPDDPVAVLVRDRAMYVVLGLYVVLAAAVIHLGPDLQILLDVNSSVPAI